MKHLFVTGAPRSGTTLADKMLSMHPGIDVLSQPLPLLYVELKAEFLASRGQEPADGYPLNDMFLSSYYPPEAFSTFLENKVIDAALSGHVLEKMNTYDGQYTKPADPTPFQTGYQPCSLVEYVSRYCYAYRAASEVLVTGSKESFCEEFIPFFLSQGAVVVQLIRDPRDAIASLMFGSADQYGGLRRPLLFCIRQWRKSAMFALARQGTRGYWLLRYEDLVTDPLDVLNPLAAALTGQRFDDQAFSNTLTTREGDTWNSNSSHRSTTRLSSGSIGGHRALMPDEVRRFIEACCYFDMIALGYTPEIDMRSCRRVLDGYQDALPLERPQLARYQWSVPRAAEERERLDAIEQGRFQAPLFIFHEAFGALCAARDRAS